MSIVLSYLLCLAAPLVLLPVEQLFAYSYVLEELAKAAIVLLLPAAFWTKKSTNSKKYLHLIALGLLFTISESMLYVMNFFILFDFSLFATRLLLTGLLHVSTFLILGLCTVKPWFKLAAALAINTSIHILFNEVIVGLI